MINYHKKNRLPTESEIEDDQFDLNFVFPEDFLHYCRTINGGVIGVLSNSEFDVNIILGAGKCELPVLSKTLQLREVWGMSDNLIAIAVDSFGHPYCFLTSKPGVWKWDQEEDNIEAVAPNFGNFIQRIKTR